MITATSNITHDIDAILDAVDERGYCTVPGMISAQETDRVRGILETIMQAERTEQIEKAKHQRVFQIAVKNRVFLDLMCHPLVVAVWKKYLGDDVMCSTWSSNTMYPGQSVYDWHADYPYWAITPPWPAGNFTGQTIWLLDDFTPENGATGVAPYSHRKLHPPTPQEKRAPRDDAELVIAPRGSVVFLHGALWHSQRPNLSTAPRTALLGMYLRPFCVPMENMRAQLEKIDHPTDLEKQMLGGNQRQPS
jgi:ectoine hydroxylase-related dioxygenase (phytanoyl-CoA dioxygenase family)